MRLFEKLGVLVFATSLLGASSALAQPRREPGSSMQERPPGSGGIRSGQSESARAPYEEGERQTSAEERRLVELREEMRGIRDQRREALREARASGDVEAIQRVQSEFAPRTEVLREEMRALREQVVAARVRENPELADRLTRARDGERSGSGCAPQTVTDDMRRRAFRRLRSLAAEGTLVDPADIPTEVREEMRGHARRMAVLNCVRDRARTAGDFASAARIRELSQRERQRLEQTVRAMLGGPEPAVRGSRARGGAGRAGRSVEARPVSASQQEDEE